MLQIGESKFYNIMSEDSIIIKNYFYITPEVLNSIKSKIDGRNDIPSLFSLFQPVQNNYSVKQFLSEKREGPENKIIINEEEKNITSNDDKIDENNIPQEKASNISIEIKNEESKIPIFLAKKRYFNIESKKKVGRKPKYSMQLSSHTKYADDNILRKLKVKFFKKLVNYINGIILSKYSKRIKVLKPLKGEVSQNNNIKFNIKLINSKLKDIFSSYEINGKFKLFEKDCNKNIVNSIYAENITELIEILEMTFIEVFDIFRNANETEKLNGFEKLDKVLNEMKLKENNEEYIIKFKEMAFNFEKFYYEKIPRRTLL